MSSEHIEATIGLDSSAFQRGLKGSLGHAREFGKELTEEISSKFQNLFAATVVVESIHKLSEYVATLNRTSEALQVSTDFLQGFMVKSELSGASSEVAIKGLEKMAVNLGKAQNGSEEAEQAFHKYNITTKDSDGTLRSVEDVLGDVAELLSKTESGAQRAAIAAGIFGKAGVKLIPTLIEGREAVKGFAESFGLFKASPENIKSFEVAEHAAKAAFAGAGGGGINLVGNILKPIHGVAGLIGAIVKHGTKTTLDDVEDAILKILGLTEESKEKGGLKIISPEQQKAIDDALDSLGKVLSKIDEARDKVSAAREDNLEKLLSPEEKGQRANAAVSEAEDELAAAEERLKRTARRAKEFPSINGNELVAKQQLEVEDAKLKLEKALGKQIDANKEIEKERVEIAKKQVEEAKKKEDQEKRHRELLERKKEAQERVSRAEEDLNVKKYDDLNFSLEDLANLPIFNQRRTSRHRNPLRTTQEQQDNILDAREALRLDREAKRLWGLGLFSDARSLRDHSYELKEGITSLKDSDRFPLEGVQRTLDNSLEELTKVNAKLEGKFANDP